MYFVLLRDLADEALEGELADEQLGGLLVPSDLAERDRARAKAVRLLHASEHGALALGNSSKRFGKRRTWRLWVAARRSADLPLMGSCTRAGL